MSEEQGQAVLLIKTKQIEFPLAIPVETIEELTRIDTEKIHPVPRSKPLFQGITLLRNQTIPVISIEKLLFKNNKEEDNVETQKTVKTKLPLIIINNKGIRVGFSFDEVLKYELISKKTKLPPKIKQSLQFPDYCVFYEIKKDEKPTNCLFTDLLGIMNQFVEIEESLGASTETVQKEEELDFDLDQFTLKEGEEFDPSKIKF